ncbi:hypothetical protein SERLA73DRAFT_119704 [Serpula lacrymans var. lacrymans S7.3]|uniref:Tc1-like transposase DDE domain-containing protein n=1 Tax=Serpula lacrymans var. lacrymans (strain S7.3) TaxID=936435 RepID=F8PLG3_SERL3|nr:hypothetical protein SERLA73DRAFT_119704 [Serpula lacrymans var. lacrymans S7.3]
MTIANGHYPDKEHIFVYNNAKTHLKRANGALSARHMPKFASKPDSNWGVDVNVRDDNGKPVYSPNGKPSKTKVHMEGATFADGTKQSLYFEPGHPQAGFFKGMAIILSKHGFIESLLEMTCKARGFTVIFIPKFHCELNFIEQCWGFAKHIYQQYPASSKEADLECNILAALESVPLDTMRRFIDAYKKGLNGKQAGWALKKYHEHCVLPECILRELYTEDI